MLPFTREPEYPRGLLISRSRNLLVCALEKPPEERGEDPSGHVNCCELDPATAEALPPVLSSHHPALCPVLLLARHRHHPACDRSPRKRSRAAAMTRSSGTRTKPQPRPPPSVAISERPKEHLRGVSPPQRAPPQPDPGGGGGCTPGPAADLESKRVPSGKAPR